MGWGIVGAIWLASAFWDFWGFVDVSRIGYYVVEGAYSPIA